MVSVSTGLTTEFIASVRRIITRVLLVILLSVAVGCASGPPSYRQNIQSAIGGRGSVTVDIRDEGTVILRGWVESLYDKNAVLRAAGRGEGIERVIDWIYVLQKFP